MTARAPGEIYIEFVVQGVFAKVTAIDSTTGTEASIVGPATAPRLALVEAARRKLALALKKKSDL